jgi:predicted SAM-dependent methyltransferase
MRCLNIGGTDRREGEEWVTMDIEEGDGVDEVGNASDLSRFPDASFDGVYASHVLEHFSYRSMPVVLKEWARVLKPGGKLYVSVPDLTILCHQFLYPLNDFQARFEIMRRIMGGHDDLHDIHLAGLYEELLAHFLTLAGFDKLIRVDSFGFFEDCSAFANNGVRISLNILATKPA